MKKNIMFLIIGIILASSITAYATIKLQANEIEYNDTTLDKVLDDLYSNTGKVTSVSFTSSSTSTQNFDIGFRPTYISCSAYPIDGTYVTIIYDYNSDSTHVLRINTTTSNQSGGTTPANAFPQLSTFFTINEDGFTWNIYNNPYWDNASIKCIINR